MHVPVLFGTETEYAITALDHEDGVLASSGIARQFHERAAARPHLPGCESGIFLASNGARFYIDAGDHPEYASAEASNPWEALRSTLAGDRLMSGLAREVSERDPKIASLVVRKGNVDLASDATWGNHESYLHRCPPDALRHTLVPHLVSRITFTGSGGFDAIAGTGLRFVLSPRARFVRRVVAHSAPGEIALVDCRAQPHCTGFHRQHVMCGDANQSHLSMLLRLGTSALVVALIDAGFIDEDAMRLADPLAALAVVTRDVTMRRRLALASGGSMTALDIQRYYLSQARTHSVILPDWADRLCDVWQATLDRLERGPDTVADRLDWAIKLALLRDRSRNWGRRWPDDDEDDGAGAETPQHLHPWQAEMCEIDLRYGQVYPPSVFHSLDDAAVLRHRVVSPDEIARALAAPPAEGRARIRATVVKRLASQCDGSTCTWDAITDAATMRTLDLSNPFAETEAWRRQAEATARVMVSRLERLVGLPASPAATGSILDIARRLSMSGGEAPAGRTVSHAVQVNNLAFPLRNSGRLDEAAGLMRAALAIDLAERHHRHAKVSHRRNNLATVLLMQGHVEEARVLVTDAWPTPDEGYDLTSMRVLTIRLAIALIDDEPAGLWLGQVKTHLAIRPLPNHADVDRRWQMGPVLNALAPQLGVDAVRMLEAIVSIVNRSIVPDELNAITGWRDTPARSLDVAWPRPSRVW